MSNRTIPTMAAMASTVISLFSFDAQAQSISGITDLPMKSRTCGLVLLSEGRAQLRAHDQGGGMENLVSAFALLQDGRALQDKVSARTASQALLTGSVEAKNTAVLQCKNWLHLRKDKPDFQNTEEDRWNWLNQAMVTMKTEKMPPAPL